MDLTCRSSICIRLIELCFVGWILTKTEQVNWKRDNPHPKPNALIVQYREELLFLGHSSCPKASSIAHGQLVQGVVKVVLRSPSDFQAKENKLKHTTNSLPMFIIIGGITISFGQLLWRGNIKECHSLSCYKLQVICNVDYSIDI